MMGTPILLLLDPGQDLAKTLVLYNGRVADALQLVEGGIGQGQAFPADLKPSIGKIVDVDDLASEASGARAVRMSAVAKTRL